MQPVRLHVFACEQKKPEGAPCCSVRGSARVIEALPREIAAAGLGDDVWLAQAGFEDARHVRLAGPTGLVIARHP